MVLLGVSLTARTSLRGDAPAPFAMGKQVCSGGLPCACHFLTQFLMRTYCVWSCPHSWGALSSGPTLPPGQQTLRVPLLTNCVAFCKCLP